MWRIGAASRLGVSGKLGIVFAIGSSCLKRKNVSSLAEREMM